MSKKDNRIVVDLNKCQYARFFYRNQHGNTVNTIPTGHTVRGCVFEPDEMIFGSMTVSLLSYAHSSGLLDRWTPEVKFQVQANHSLTYTGDKAVSLYKEWNRRIFSKKK